MRIGIIGLGVIAKEFVAAIYSHGSAELAAVCDLDDAKLDAFVDAEVARFRSHHDLIAAGLCDAVIVTLPNDLHATVVRDLLDAGIHVSCEKPLTLDPKDAIDLAAAATQAGVVLRTAFHRRFNRNLLDLLDRVNATDSPVINVRVRYFEDIREHTGGETWYLDRDRCGGGCIVDNGPNALDMARLIVGEMRLDETEIGDVRHGIEFLAHLQLTGRSGERVQVDLDWAWHDGELKDIDVEFANGTHLTANMLDGFSEFKSSLQHEYVGILDDFVVMIESGTDDLDQVSIVQLVHDAMHIGRRRHTRLRMPSKLDVNTSVVRLLFHETDARGMRLSHHGSACVRRGEIHELVVTTDATDSAGSIIDRIGYIGFIEFTEPAMLTRGDTFWYGNIPLGEFAGYDESHMPNHLNLILRHSHLITAEDFDLRPRDVITIKEGRQREFVDSDDPGAWSNQHQGLTAEATR